jgi:hypothetical protein
MRKRRRTLEVMNLLEEFRDRMSVLKGVNYNDSTGRLIEMLKWLESEALTKRMIDELKQATNITEIFGRSGQGERPKTNTGEEMAAVGLHLIEVCRDHKKLFFDLCLQFDLSPPYQTNSVQSYCDAGLTDYVLPFLVYIERGLVKASEAYSVESVAEGRFSGLLSAEIKSQFPKTSAGLERISSEFLRPEADVMWQNVGNSCRQVLIEFSSEVREVCEVELPADVKEGDVKPALNQVLAETCSSKRFRQTLSTLLEGVWNHTQTLVHRPSATKRDASQVFLWTGMLVSEFVQVVRAYNDG